MTLTLPTDVRKNKIMNIKYLLIRMEVGQLFVRSLQLTKEVPK